MKYVKNYSTIAQATADTTAVSPLLAFCSENAQVFNLMVGGIDTPLEISAQNGVISVQEKPVGPPNDEIWYTSSDGNIVTPYSTSALPTIVSNTYVDGKGVIKFKTDVTSIGNSAFEDCRGLTSVTIPNSVTSIGDSAFLCGMGLYKGSLETIFVGETAFTYDGVSQDFNITLGNSTVISLLMYYGSPN